MSTKFDETTSYQVFRTLCRPVIHIVNQILFGTFKYFTIYPKKKWFSAINFELQCIWKYQRHLRTGLLQNIRNDEAFKDANKSWFTVDDALWFHLRVSVRFICVFNLEFLNE